MKRSLPMFALLLLWFSPLSAQIETGNIPVAMSAGGGQYATLYANLLHKRKQPIHATLGSPYLFDEWTTGTVDIGGETYILEQARLDLMENAIEVMYEGEPKYIDARNFTRFSLLDKATGKTLYFVNANLYKLKGERFSPGIMKVTQVGQYNILVHLKARLVHPSQAMIINGVDPRPKYVKEKFFYIEHQGTVYPVRKKKDLYAALRQKQSKVKQYLKHNKVNVRDEQDLRDLLIYVQQ